MKGFCVSKEDIGDLTKWRNINNLVDTIEDIYSGLLNTLNIIDSNGSVDSAANNCKKYIGGDFTNWYLPSKEQLSYIFDIKSQIGNLKDDYYLSSTNVDIDNIYVRDMTDGIQNTVTKDTYCYVRDFELDIPLSYLKMNFSDKNNSDYLSISYWNTFFNTTLQEQGYPDSTYCTPYIGNDGQSYKTVKIGKQVWLAENLIETKYRNDLNIVDTVDNTQWSALTQSSYCVYDNVITNAYPIV